MHACYTQGSCIPKSEVEVRVLLNRGSVIPSKCEPINSQPLNASHISTHPHLIGLEIGNYCAHQKMQFYDFYRMMFKQ